MQPGQSHRWNVHFGASTLVNETTANEGCLMPSENRVCNRR
jgi:hypothetical protein